jgi:hypothetical protein
MGVVAAVGRDPASPALVDYPVTESAGKADRLSLIPNRDTVDGAASSAAEMPTALAEPSPAPQTKSIAPEPRAIARHRHEPTNPNLKKKRRVASTKQQQAITDEKPIRTVDCNRSGLDGVLRSMRLKPGCL